MTFNVSDFSAKLNQYGLARDNLFYVAISPPSFGADIPLEDLTFFCRSVELPGLGVNTVDIQSQGYGIAEKRPASMTFDNLNTIFMVDSYFKVKDFFHKWMQYIINFDNSRGYTTTINGARPFEFQYKDTYTGTITVYVYSYGSNTLQYVYKFENAFPTNLGSITTSWENNDNIMTLPVSFAYDIYNVDALSSSLLTTYQGNDAGIPGTEEALYALGVLGRSIEALSTSQTIQDIINQYTQVESVFDSIREILN